MMDRRPILLLMLLVMLLAPAAEAATAATAAPGASWINVRDFGAKGDGKADDGPAMRAAFAAVGSHGGTVYFPAGVYRGSVAGNPENTNYKAVGILPSHVKVVGDGMGASVIGLLPDQPQGAYVLLNSHIGSGGDEDITLEDLTVDGFAADQHPQYSQNGLGVLRMKNLTCRHVRFRDVYGTASSGVGESFHAEFGLSTNALFEGCEVEGASGTTASGFSADASTGITYIACRAYGMKVSCGFTHNACSHVTYIGCQSYLNPNGFNSEVSHNITYVGCTAGGLTTDKPAFPYRPSTPLGNTGPYGQFIINGDSDVLLQGCTARQGNSGAWIQGSSHVLIDGGDFSSNHHFGVHMDRQSLQTTRIAVGVMMHDNGEGALDLPNGRSACHGPLPTPGFPMPGKTLLSPFPMDATVYITGGNVTDIAIDGVVTGVRAGTVRLPAGSTISIAYSGNPHWRWIAG